MAHFYLNRLNASLVAAGLRTLVRESPEPAAKDDTIELPGELSIQVGPSYVALTWWEAPTRLVHLADWTGHPSPTTVVAAVKRCL